MTETEMRAALASLGIESSVTEHAPVMTVEDSASLYQQLAGVHSKNLFLKDAGGKFWLVTVPAAARPDLKALAPAMGAKKLSFGNADDMLRLLELTPGSVTPLGACNDIAGEVRIVLDRAIAQAKVVYVHPLRNTATLGLAGVNLVKALTAWNHAPLVIAVPLRAD